MEELQLKKISELPTVSSYDILEGQGKLLINNGSTNMLLMLNDNNNASVIDYVRKVLLYDSFQESMTNNITLLLKSINVDIKNYISGSINEVNEKIDGIEYSIPENITTTSQIGSLPAGTTINKGTTLELFIKMICGYALPSIQSFALIDSNGNIITGTLSSQFSTGSTVILKAKILISEIDNVKSITINNDIIVNKSDIIDNYYTFLTPVTWNNENAISNSMTLEITDVRNTKFSVTVSKNNYLNIKYSQVISNENVDYDNLEFADLGNANDLTTDKSLGHKYYQGYIVFALPNYEPWQNYDITGYGSDTDFAFTANTGINVNYVKEITIDKYEYKLYITEQEVAENMTIYIRR